MDYKEIETVADSFYENIKFLIDNIIKSNKKEIFCSLQKKRKFSCPENLTISSNLINSDKFKYMPIDKLFNNDELANNQLLNTIMDKSNSTNVSPIMSKSFGSQVRVSKYRSKRLKECYSEFVSQNQENSNTYSGKKQLKSQLKEKFKFNNNNNFNNSFITKKNIIKEIKNSPRADGSTTPKFFKENYSFKETEKTVSSFFLNDINRNNVNNDINYNDTDIKKDEGSLEFNKKFSFDNKDKKI